MGGSRVTLGSRLPQWRGRAVYTSRRVPSGQGSHSGVEAMSEPGLDMETRASRQTAIGKATEVPVGPCATPGDHPHTMHGPGEGHSPMS